MANWRCPYCLQNATLQDANKSNDQHSFSHNNLDGPLGLFTSVSVCPNQDCRQYVITASLWKRVFSQGTWTIHGIVPLQEWSLRPNSSAKPLPDYIPKAIAEDYQEACLIETLSPKASATLSRRALQGMIRDFHGIVKPRLFDEITALQEKTDPLTWAAIDAVRKIGNIGAHMEKDIDSIIEVELDEARLLIELIETLIDEWYVERHARTLRMNAIIAAAAAKSARKANGEVPSA